MKFGNLRNPVMINSHQVVNDKMVYAITIRLKDCTWGVFKRYSEFEVFHQALLEESLLAPEEYPPLPKKRWFEINRWTQRNDEEYTKERRGELQKYLQILFRTNDKILVQKSKTLQTFLDFHHLVATMMNRRELLNSVDGESSPPTSSSDSDADCDDEAGNDDYEQDNSQSDRHSPNIMKERRGSALFDMFSISTGSEDNETETKTELSPGKEDNSSTGDRTPDGRGWRENVSVGGRAPQPLKSCLKPYSKYDGSDRTVAKSATKAKQKKQQQSEEGINALEELKDFVKILIL